MSCCYSFTFCFVVFFSKCVFGNDVLDKKETYRIVEYNVHRQEGDYNWITDDNAPFHPLNSPLMCPYYSCNAVYTDALSETIFYQLQHDQGTYVTTPNTYLRILVIQDARPQMDWYTERFVAIRMPACNAYPIPNGNFQQNYAPSQSAFGISCIPYGITIPFTGCPPGTWLTCRSAHECNFWAIRSASEWNYNDESNIVRIARTEDKFIPVGHCFSCEDGYNKYHYKYEGASVCSNDGRGTPDNVCMSYVDFRLYSGRIYCPGHVAPPQICPEDKRSSADFSTCVCKDGMYDNATSCLDCPAGHFCVNGVKQVCPTDHYQNEKGKSYCNKCLTLNGDPVRQCPPNSDQAPAKCQVITTYRYEYQLDASTGVYSVVTVPSEIVTTYVENIECVPCSRCKNNVLQKYDSDSTIDYIDCYI